MILPGPKMMVGKRQPNLGDAYEGGYFLGQNVIGSDTYNLVVSPVAGQNNGVYWKDVRSETAGTESTVDGYSNTAAMGNDPSSHPAYTWVSGLTINSFSDWYIPSEVELSTVFANRAYLPSSDAWDPLEHWSSTQATSNLGMARLMDSGGSYSDAFKNRSEAIRAIRRVKA